MHNHLTALPLIEPCCNAGATLPRVGRRLTAHARRAPAVADRRTIQRLVEMGFSEAHALNALEVRACAYACAHACSCVRREEASAARNATLGRRLCGRAMRGPERSAFA